MAAKHSINPGQLKMFMSADEITTHYQPLDFDRESPDYDDGGWTAATYRSTMESPSYLRDRSEIPYHGRYTGTRGGGEGLVTMGGGFYRERPEHYESDEEVWQRKAEESTEYHTGVEDQPYERSYGGYDMGGFTSLYEDIQEQGVQHPVRLGTQFGESGKPQVTGGHHRIAAQRDIDPHKLMPVIHHEGGIGEARRESEKGPWEYR